LSATNIYTSPGITEAEARMAQTHRSWAGSYRNSSEKVFFFFF
jgi:hypothetical protein